MLAVFHESPLSNDALIVDPSTECSECDHSHVCLQWPIKMTHEGMFYPSLSNSRLRNIVINSRILLLKVITTPS